MLRGRTGVGGARDGREGTALAVSGRARGRGRERRRTSQTLVGPKTRVVDLHGRLVVPGFNDAHVHFLDGGFGLLSVDLRGARDESDFARRIGGAREGACPRAPGS